LVRKENTTKASLSEARAQEPEHQLAVEPEQEPELGLELGPEQEPAAGSWKANECK
jgi:hypothetical protein